MENNLESLFLRKLSATFVTTIFLSALFIVIHFINGFESAYHRGNQFMGWFTVYALYIGMIILIYGNAVAIAIEYLQSKWFRQHDWLYVLILGFFGLANGIIFQDGMAALYGMPAAIIYGMFDKWLDRRKRKKKSVNPFWIIPIACLGISWGYLEVTSPPMPPFTKEDAVDFATYGEGTLTDDFPDNIGQWEGTVEGYHITKETDAEEIGDETYIVTFTEHWKKGRESGTWTASYEVDRQSMTTVNIEGKRPS
ncbi:MULTISPECIES: hypothetical protein [Oceanobacillus]|uniref:Uncharacterized protein n=1 Tax=Oceanobacillus aidingensis TaxID=645964 RepID=A0ABV9JY47_9BACI|nr:hypothetical protein [Oceanobacillus oncorhynchi]MDM8102505.1 hypothetical protein [Oceanobacillus oncorhynchi]